MNRTSGNAALNRVSRPQHLERFRAETRSAPAKTYAYDGNSNLTQQTDRHGKVTVYQYDGLNRPTFAGFGYSGTCYESSIGYTWDGGDRLTGATDSITGAITRVPDLLDRLTSETTPQGSITYGCDNANRRTTMQVAGQAQVSYTWDNANRMTGITQGSTAVGISYDNADRRTSLTLPNGVTVGYSVDNDSRITGLSYGAGGSQLGNLSYGYDADGRVISKGGTLAATGVPTSVSGNTFNADNGMTAFGGASLSYDANGNLTSDGTNTYTWDARNHLTAIGGAATASFTYDAFGRRASKSIAGTTTQFLYDGSNPMQELQGGAPTANLLTGLSIDEYFARTDSNNNISTLLADALGSTIGLVGSGQNMATSYSFQAFGATTTAGTANGNSYQFTGRENDGTGLYFYRARYYSPTFQRFVAQDPAEFGGGGANLYGYVLEQPTVRTDPSGLCGNRPCLPNVGQFISAHYADAQTIAQSMPPGVTPEDVLAVSAGETMFGGGFADVGNYFGLHDPSTGPYAGQDGYSPSGSDGPMATFPDSSGFLQSGQAFAQDVSPFLNPSGPNPPATFFDTAHQHGWGEGNKDYVQDELSVLQRIEDCLN